MTRGGVASMVDDAHGIDPAVLAAADVVDDRELAVGRDLDVERGEAGGHVVILAVTWALLTFWPSMSSNPTRLAPLLTTSARLPSGVIATAAGSAGGGEGTVAVGLVATDTVPTGFTFLPSIDSTVTESSARLATSAKVPAR